MKKFIKKLFCKHHYIWIDLNTEYPKRYCLRCAKLTDKKTGVPKMRNPPAPPNKKRIEKCVLCRCEYETKKQYSSRELNTCDSCNVDFKNMWIKKPE